MESRIEILDRLSKKWGKGAHIQIVTFDDFLSYFDNHAITELVYIAMREYEEKAAN